MEPRRGILFEANVDTETPTKASCWSITGKSSVSKERVELSPEQLASDFVLGNIFVLVYFVMSFSILDPNDPTQRAIMDFFAKRITYILGKYEIAEIMESL